MAHLVTPAPSSRGKPLDSPAPLPRGAFCFAFPLALGKDPARPAKQAFQFPSVVRCGSFRVPFGLASQAGLLIQIQTWMACRTSTTRLLRRGFIHLLGNYSPVCYEFPFICVYTEGVSKSSWSRAAEAAQAKTMRCGIMVARFE